MNETRAHDLFIINIILVNGIITWAGKNLCQFQKFYFRILFIAIIISKYFFIHEWNEFTYNEIIFARLSLTYIIFSFLFLFFFTSCTIELIIVINLDASSHESVMKIQWPKVRANYQKEKKNKQKYAEYESNLQNFC